MVSERIYFNPDITEQTIDLIFKMQKSNAIKRKACIICDDFDLTSSHDSLNALHTRGRHYNITTILSAQITTKGISTSIRNNTNFLFVRKLNAKTLTDNVFQMLLNKEFHKGHDFYNFVKQNNGNFQFILYLNDDRPSNEAISIVKASKANFQFNYTKPKKDK
jgi:hypothetical protein